MIVHWWGYVTSNFGDALTPWMIRRCGHVPVYASAAAEVPNVVGAGSIFGDARAPATIWGTGIGSWMDPIAAHLEIRAVRGPLTRARAEAIGVPCPAVYGDPALLLPRLYTPAGKLSRSRLGIVPHFVDQQIAQAFYAGVPDMRVIDLLAPIEQVIDEIASCDAILSSSLHGLVVAAAYEIPFGWARFSGGVAGDGTKFRDFYMSVGIDPPAEPMHCEAEAFSVENFASWIPPYAAKVNVSALWDACPFRPVTT